MIDITTLEVSGFKGAIFGMRKPLKSEDKSDSGFRSWITGNYEDRNGRTIDANLVNDSIWYPGTNTFIGPKDLALAQKLLRAGTDDHSKFMRYIHVQADVDAPLYWWKEYDTYKVSTVANSESTMHTIHSDVFSVSDFSHDMLLDDYTIEADWELEDTYPELFLEDTVDMLNELRRLYLKAVDEKNGERARDYWYNMIQLLPTSYMQARTIDLNYQTLRHIYFARKDHKLTEWHKFTDWICELPYAEELITYKP